MSDTWIWSPDETGIPLTPDAYAATGGTACPACLGAAIAEGGDVTLGRQVVTRRLLCEHCGASWLAVYTLTWYDGLHVPLAR